MKPGVALTLSLCVNVALAVAAVKVLQPRPPAMSAPPAESGAKTETVRIVTNLPPETTFVTNGFHWRVLASTNYDVFVANLRAVGCPERTIRDIVVGEVWHQYQRAEAHKDYSTPFWLNGPRRVATQRAREAELIRLRTGLAATLRRLFGCEWSPKLERDRLEDDVMLGRLLVGDVPEEQFERALGLIVAAMEAKNEVRWRCRGVFLGEDHAELCRRRDDVERRLRAVLTPVQFEEFRARVGFVEFIMDRDEVLELTPTGDELRRIGLAITSVRPLGWSFLDLNDGENAVDKPAAEQELESRLLEVLGAERFAELELLGDSDYRSIHAFARDKSLPKETARKLYAVRQLAQEEVRRLRDDKTLEAATRTAELEAVGHTLLQEVGTLLGDQLLDDYLGRSGQWVTNINQL